MAQLLVSRQDHEIPSKGKNLMNSAEQKEFLQATAWLRPFTRWAAAFSIKTEVLLPPPIRNLPLKMVKLVLARQHKKLSPSCKTMR
jgi:hypothetical protein